jgi:hypothetical protein
MAEQQPRKAIATARPRVGSYCARYGSASAPELRTVARIGCLCLEGTAAGWPGAVKQHLLNADVIVKPLEVLQIGNGRGHVGVRLPPEPKSCCPT